MTNSSQTEPSSHDPLGRSRSEIALEVALAILICLTSILDNLLVIYVVNNDSRLKNVTNIFIHNLALTDICMASLQMPFWIISLHKGAWVFSGKWCELSAAIVSTLGVASILNMGLIAFNRYIRVVKPTLHNKLFPGMRMARLYSAIVWIASTLLATPPLYGWGKMAYHPSFAFCTITYKIQYISYATVVIGLFMVTTIAMFYFYYKIYKTLKESTQNLNAHSTEDGVTLSERRRTDIKLLKTTFTVLCTFLLTWGSASIVVIVETAGCFIPRKVFMATACFMYAGSLANPVIHGIMNPQFQAAFKRALSFGRYGNDQVRPSRTGNVTRSWRQHLLSWDDMRT